MPWNDDHVPDIVVPFPQLMVIGVVDVVLFPVQVYVML